MIPSALALATAERDSKLGNTARQNAAAASDAREEPDPGEVEALSRAERLQYFDALSARIDSEATDGAWRSATEGPLARLISEQLGSKVSVAEATCASSYCRVQLNHPEWARLPPDLMFAFDLARTSLQVTEAEYDNRDEGATTLYFKRGSAPANQADLADTVPSDTVPSGTVSPESVPPETVVANTTAGALTDTE